jgi:hypothetical protein
MRRDFKYICIIIHITEKLFLLDLNTKNKKIVLTCRATTETRPPASSRKWDWEG